ncbi:phosphonate C-P lyase system protein PhnL [Candidatus Viridilinea mediisalina]|uniref:Phosphonate C-P lyase system protein PhnL n=1 Tax=Candidatus Viridilinea mediisalina TaxID=2024553 RepID=A0A2A6RQ16_9CHLR|nr:ATP-binding cassette domain-containing protein [Candidatus Viridilinea mediisalina]PDW04960.1 phosphonate C-P lyase system protein PhnL [Candidatus Viridilinea mediisalina]
MNKTLLTVEDLTKSFVLHLIDGRTITPVQAISFSIAPQDHLLIHGRSGMGKTSILKCIYRSYLATAGRIWFTSQLYGRIDLVAAHDSTILRLREREIGYCSQFLRVLPRVSALDVICEPLYRQGWARDAAQEQGRQWLRDLGIRPHLWQASPVTFSGGEQQRINLGRAFIAAPRLLLLDEPTASLDGETKQIVVHMIQAAQANGTSVISVSHDLAALGPCANRQLALA